MYISTLQNRYGAEGSGAFGNPPPPPPVRDWLPKAGPMPLGLVSFPNPGPPETPPPPLSVSVFKKKKESTLLSYTYHEIH